MRFYYDEYYYYCVILLSELNDLATINKGDDISYWVDFESRKFFNKTKKFHKEGQIM